MTRSTGVRQYRACTRCRARKTRCNLQGKPPCAKCITEGAECTLAGSRRGGDYSQHRKPKQQLRRHTRQQQQQQQKQPAGTPTTEPELRNNLQNPTDALLILAHAAGDANSGPSTDSPHGDDGGDDTHDEGGHDEDRASAAVSPECLEFTDVLTYPPILQGDIEPTSIGNLLQHYAENYHAFFPVVPAKVLLPAYLPDTVKHEAFLLTAVLVVASRDKPELAAFHQSICTYMQSLILQVVLGVAGVRRVGSVEGLLLLGEWPSLWCHQGHHHQPEDGGEGAAWSILGLAVRLAYLLRLEESSFKAAATADDGDCGAGGGEDSKEESASKQRRRLAWTFTYLSDRQISIRMGQAFWCRGPALSTRFTARDFPSLQPTRGVVDSNGGGDLASLLQAQVELTTLFGNAHDILFSSALRTASLMRRGDYTKYIDDTVRAVDAWEQAWHRLDVPPHLKCCLAMMQYYLRLYVNAFAFQAVLYRSSPPSSTTIAAHTSEAAAADTATMALHSVPRASAMCFPDSTMASPDARYIYAAVEAAEALLKIMIEDIEPEKHLRHMPARFYLYEIHSTVFLYKAHAAGAVSAEKHAQTGMQMRRFIAILEATATDQNHIAARYAKLLQGLWFSRGSLHPAPLLGGGGGGGGGDGASFAPEAEVQQGRVVPPPPPIPDDTAAAALSDDIMSSSWELYGATGGLTPSQLPLFDSIGLQQFDCTDAFDGLFSMPPVFPWDQAAGFEVG